MEHIIYSRYSNSSNQLLERFKHVNHVDSLANGNILNYDAVLNVDYGNVLLFTDLYMQKLQIQEMEINKQKLKRK